MYEVIHNLILKLILYNQNVDLLLQGVVAFGARCPVSVFPSTLFFYRFESLTANLPK